MKSQSVLALVAILLPGVACTPPQVGSSPPAGSPVPSVVSPTHLRVTGHGQLPPLYTLRWVAPADIAVDHYIVLRSTVSITEDNRAAATAVTTTDPLLVVEIHSGTGSQFFRVLAVDSAGAETSLSDELQVETTARVAYLADALVDNAYDLYTLPLAGGTPSRLTGVAALGSSVRRITWSPDGRRLAFTGDLDVLGREELYAVSADGALPPVKVSGPTLPWIDVTAFAWSPDGRQIAFVADRLNDGVFGLYVTPIDTLVPQLVSPLALRRTGYDGVIHLSWSPDATRIAYTADTIIDNVFELFVVDPTQPGAAIRVSGALTRFGGAADGVSDFAWSPDGKALAYLANATLPGMRDLFTVAPEGGIIVNLSAALASFGSVHNFAWSPDSASVAFTADKLIPGAVALWAVPADASSTPKLLSGLPLAGTGVQEFAWARDGSRIGLRGDIAVAGLTGLYTVKPDGTGRVQINGPLVANSKVLSDWAWSSDGAHVAFRGSLGVSTNDELFIAGATGATLQNAVPTLLLERNVAGLNWSADGTRLVYRADQEVTGQIALYLAPADPLAGISVRLAGFLPAFANVSAMATSPLCVEDAPSVTGAN